MNPMIEKLGALGPEMALLTGACVCLALGLSGRPDLRGLCAWAAAAALVVAGVLAWQGPWSGPGVVPPAGQGTAWEPDPSGFVKLAVAAIGLLLVMLMARVPTRLEAHVAVYEDADDPAVSERGEFFAFVLFSLTGAMLCAGAGDLVWLFLALELTSLPTYVMVATGSRRMASSEAAVKYFFLGALATATFLYGFALIYGATGSTDFAQIRAVADAQLTESTRLSALFVGGLLLSVLGLCFKIAAVPMHFYVADVYQGAATPVTALLAFVPKTAGFVALILILGLINWELPAPLTRLLWVLAAATMTVGNVLGLLQNNVKRVLAYSSIAHSGYMLVGLIAGGAAAGGATLGNGVAAVLFYLVGYGLATLAAFGVLGCLQRNGEEAELYEDIAGLSRRHPGLAAVMLIAVLSLLGFPLTVGFLGKVYLFGSAMSAGHVALVVIAVLNSAVSAVYYLRIVGACYFGESSDPARAVHGAAPHLASGIAALAAVVLFIAGGRLVAAARDAAAPARTEAIITVEQDAEGGQDSGEQLTRGQ